MLTVLIEVCDNDASALARTLIPLVPAAVDGLVREVVLIDRGIGDTVRVVAAEAGCAVFAASQTLSAIEVARSDWLLMLRPGAELGAGWTDAVLSHAATSKTRVAARFRLSGPSWWARLNPIRPAGLARGLLVPRTVAVARYRPGETLEDLARGLRPVRLAAAMTPGRTPRPSDRSATAA